MDGIDLRWGNADAAIQMIHKIACREGFGNVLADGVKRAAAQIGRGAEKYAMHVKGQELPMHEPRGKVSVGLGYAISPTGADHMEADHDPSFEVLGANDSGLEALGLIEPIDRLDMSPAKVRAFFYAQTAWCLYNSVGMCDFVGMPINALKLDMLQDYVNAATGWNMSLFELMKVGERANTMARLFNNREGFTAADDTLPDRLFEGLGNGHLQGRGIDRGEFAQMVKTYYQMAGWDEDGVPTPAKLAELALA
jgi:aldehyde:ferredoxin oxidoreductase